MTDLCAAADVPDGGALIVAGPAADGSREAVSLVVVRDGESLRAYRNRCPHFGIPLDIGRGVKTFRKHLLCVNHYAAFRFDDGYCVEGPCLGASLDAVAVLVADGRVVREDAGP